MKIQFLSFEGCPLADAARDQLDQALNARGFNEKYEEIDIMDPDTTEDLRSWGSPTILVNGLDVTGFPKGDSVGCRIYPGPERVPNSNEIIKYFKSALAK